MEGLHMVIYRRKGAVSGQPWLIVGFLSVMP